MEAEIKRKRSGTLGGIVSQYRTEFMALMMFALLMLQRTIFGFKYFPMIDDWFLYYGRSVADDVMSTVDLSVRPFAGLADVLIYTPLTGNMAIAQVLLTAMLAAAVYFLHKAFEGSKISAGAMLMAVIALSPIGFEALYWIAAASRIIASLFFASLAVYAEMKYLNTKKKRYLIIFAVSSLFAVGFYETMIPIFFALTVIIMLKHRKSVWIMVFPVIFTAAAILYYKLSSGNPTVAERADLITADMLGYHIGDAFDWYTKVFGELQFQLIGEAFMDGLRVIFENPVHASFIAAVAVIFALISKGERNDGRLWYDLLMGVGLIAAAISVVFILSYVRIPFRVAYPVCIGTALIVEAVLCRILPGWIYKIVTFLLVAAFSICNIGELSLYKWNNDRDEEYCSELMRIADAHDDSKAIFIFNERSYWYTDRVQHYEYVKAITENYASITGMVQYKGSQSSINNIMTVHDNDIIGIYDYSNRNADLYYIDDSGDIKPCYAVRSGENFNIMSEVGEFVGSLTRDGDGMKYENNDK